VTWVEAREVLDAIWNGSMYWVVHGAWEKTRDGAWAWSEKKKGQECGKQELETGK
jgi:hypothetical protein